MTSLSREARAKMMAEFEAKNGPVETIPVKFEDRVDRRAYREASYARTQEIRRARKAKEEEGKRKALEPKLRRQRKPKQIPPSVQIRIDRIKQMAGLLGVTEDQLQTAARQSRLVLRMDNQGLS